MHALYYKLSIILTRVSSPYSSFFRCKLSSLYCNEFLSCVRENICSFSTWSSPLSLWLLFSAARQSLSDVMFLSSSVICDNYKVCEDSIFNNSKWKLKCKSFHLFCYGIFKQIFNKFWQIWGKKAEDCWIFLSLVLNANLLAVFSSNTGYVLFRKYPIGKSQERNTSPSVSMHLLFKEPCKY